MTKDIRGSGAFFYRKMIMIAFPVMLQNLISIGLNLIDTLMIGRVGVDELAAVGAANQVYFIFSMTAFGIYSGAAVYTAQFWGAQDISGIRKVVGIDFAVGGTMALCFTVGAFFGAPHILWLFAKDPEVIAYGTQYLRLVCFSYVFTALSYVLSFNSRSIQRLAGPTCINAAAMLVNTVLNYGLIYGNLGMPRLGVRGAALATLIARITEFSVLIIYIYHDRSHPLAASFKELTSFGSDMFRKVMKTALPVVISEGTWSIATSAYFIAYGILGASALAVAQVASVVNEFSQSIYFGLGNAAAVMIGEKLGQGRTDEVEMDAKRVLNIVMVMNFIVTLALISVRGPIASFYRFDGATTELLKSTLFVWALFITPKMFEYLLICGILRAGGDTRFCMVVDVLGNWLVGLPMAFAGVTLFHFPLPLVVAMVSSADILKAIICWYRYKQKKWICVLVDTREDEPEKGEITP
ncbi:MATE family efflux transporter [Bacilliculturomica massiliensis]|uniref:MATE family efflux transporter n=1 Tax=Bacilliculturomica massiliensis TaxID=1917867 RepID=UPI001C20C5AE|nr:MATE family efflux transporter [Bacilliculturomica massiliensis]